MKITPAEIGDNYKTGTIFGFTIDEISNALGFQPTPSGDGKSCAVWNFTAEIDEQTHDCSIWDWKRSSDEKYFSCFMPDEIRDEMEKYIKQKK